MPSLFCRDYIRDRPFVISGKMTPTKVKIIYFNTDVVGLSLIEMYITAMIPLEKRKKNVPVSLIKGALYICKSYSDVSKFKMSLDLHIKCQRLGLASFKNY